MAILLEEEGLYDRARLYATDSNEALLADAREGIFPASEVREHARNYALAGGRAALSDYYLSRHDFAVFRRSLRRNIGFAHHNLTTDGSFNEFNVIVCRDVLTCFDGTLQARVHRLLYASLRRFGLLALGREESLAGIPHERDYEPLGLAEKVYRKIA